MDNCRHMIGLSFLLFKRSISTVLSKNKVARFVQYLIFCFLFVYLMSVQAYIYIYCAENVSWEASYHLILFFTMLVTGICFCMLIGPGIFDASDHNTIFSLPIDKKTFVKARMIYFFCLSSLWALMVWIPATVMVITCGFTLKFWLYITVSMVMIVVATGCMIWLWIAIYTTLQSKRETNHNMWIIFVLVSFAYFSFVVVNVVIQVFEMETSEILMHKVLLTVANGLARYIIPLNIVSAALSPSMLGIIILLVFVISCFAMAHGLTLKYLEYKEKEVKTLSGKHPGHRRVGLFMRELWVIRMNKGYLAHLIIENMLAPLIVLYLLGLVKICSIYSSEMGSVIDLLKSNTYTVYIVLAIAMEVMLSQSGCHATMSREGQRYWIIRALPIAPEKIFFYKSLIVLVMTEFAGLCSFLAIILLRLFSVKYVGSVYILLFSSIFAHTSVIGIKDYKRPYLSWESVKRLTNGNPNVLIGLLYVNIYMIVEGILFVLFRVMGLGDVVSNLILSVICLAVGIWMYMSHYEKMRKIFNSSSAV